MVAGAYPVPVAQRWLAGAAERVAGGAAFIYAALLIGAVDASGGGYGPPTWGWVAIVTLWVAAVALVSRSLVRPSFRQLVFLGGLFAYAGWVSLSLLWTSSVPSTVHSLQLAVAL